jgi:hypothetical protein
MLRNSFKQYFTLAGVRNTTVFSLSQDAYWRKQPKYLNYLNLVNI